MTHFSETHRHTQREEGRNTNAPTLLFLRVAFSPQWELAGRNVSCAPLGYLPQHNSSGNQCACCQQQQGPSAASVGQTLGHRSREILLHGVSAIA